MSYDLRRLRLHGLIERASGTNPYTLTPEGIRVAIFYTKVCARVLGPPPKADQPPAPTKLGRAPGTIEHMLGDYIRNAHLGTAA
jgi:predicted MarR family transcription regulator